MTAHKDHRLMVVDVETTGLDVAEDFLLEVAVLVLDEGLRSVGTFRSLVTEAGSYETILGKLHPRARAMHEHSGLLVDLKAEYATEQRRTAPKDVEAALARFMMDAGCDPGHVVMVGYSVQFDQQVLRRALPLIPWLCHYQLIDVGAVRRVFNLAGFDLKKRAVDGREHRALDDARTAAEELRDLVRLAGSARALVSEERPAYE